MKLLFVILFLVGAPAGASSVPTFTRGTMTSTTTSFTTVTETYNIVEYSTGSSYSMSGTNITVPGTPNVNTNYSQTVPGASTQFSESYLGPGISRVTNFTRTTTIDSVTESLSVFTQ
jgi:hypothetical protein